MNLVRKAAAVVALGAVLSIPVAAPASAQGAGWLARRALQSFATRFPDQTQRERPGALIEPIPSDHDLPAFRPESGLPSDSG